MRPPLDPDALATLVHISDLHIGLDLEDPDHALQYHKLARLQNFLPVFDSDSDEAEEALEDFWQDLSRARPRLKELYAVPSGDLTAFADQRQFERFEELMGAGIGGDGPGLNSETWSRHTIPGNHDHWQGWPSLVGPPSEAADAFFHVLGMGTTTRFNPLVNEEIPLASSCCRHCP